MKNKFYIRIGYDKFRKINYLITHYLKNEYSIRDFTNLFKEYYLNYLEIRDVVFTKETEDWLSKLDDMCGRFDTDKQEALITGAYTKKDIDEFLSNYSKLNIIH